MRHKRSKHDFITENGKEAVLDVVNISHPNSKKIDQVFYVLSVPIVKQTKYLPKDWGNWLDEPHLWFVTLQKVRGENYLMIERAEKPQGLLSDDILERFALMMQLYRTLDLFLN